MDGSNLNFSKIVSTPTLSSWSQAYSAGNLFAVFSLTSDNLAQTEQETLPTLGKNLISTFESEFFTLETKNLESIKQALITTFARVPAGISVSFVVCFLTENVLYLYAQGGGRAVLKRGEKIGTVLEADDDEDIKSASGYVKDNDLIVFETKAFQKIVASSTLAQALDNNTPQEISEEISPHVHERADGGAAALVLAYKEGIADEETISAVAAAAGEAKAQSEPLPSPEESAISEVETPGTEEVKASVETQETEVLPHETAAPKMTTQEETRVDEEIPSLSQESPYLSDQIKKRRRFNLSFLTGISAFFTRLPRRRRIIAIVAVILAVLIITLAVFAITNKGGQKDLYNSVYNQAQTKYEEGQNLKDLNAALAQESFKEAQNIITTNISKFDSGGDERNQLQLLLNKVNEALGTGGEQSSTKEVGKDASKLLSSEIDNSQGVYFAQNEDFIYFIDSDGVQRIDKGNNDKEEIIAKDWDAASGIGLFGSNVYVLDKEDNVLKFVPSGDNFSKSNYFSSDAPDLSTATAMAIDGSVYVLSANTITKYTRGSEDDFEISGLDNGLSSPTKVYTNEDTDNLYVLDNGNSRVVVLDKEGNFVNAYTSDIVKNAKDLDVDEAGRKIFVLSGGKIYQIDIK